MKLDISPTKQLPISAVSVHSVLGVPLGGGELAQVRTKGYYSCEKTVAKAAWHCW
uniref:Uncharacterized protein n=1 Tax=Arundo donax TaxID=35708 RepID=A0A0A9AGN8_ARUDO